MGIFSTIKEKAKNVVKNVVKSSRKEPKHEQTVYTTTEQDGNTVKTTVSNQPPQRKMDDKVNRFYAAGEKAAGYVIGKSRAVADTTNNAITRTTGAIKKTPAMISKRIPTRTVEFVRERAEAAKPMFEKARKTSIRQDIALPGNAVIRAFTGKDPAKQYMKISKKRSKKTELGRKISKKEKTALAKKYGKNWQMAIKQRSNRSYYATPADINMIRRENALDSTSVYFGSMFPEPNQAISSEYSRQPFVPRNTDPMDIEANFMGMRGGMLRKRDPFAIKGIKL